MLTARCDGIIGRACAATGMAVFVVSLPLIAAVWYRFANNSQPFNTFARIFDVTLVYLGIRGPFAQLTGQVTHRYAPPTIVSRANGGLDTTGFQSILAYKLPLHQVTEYLILIALIVTVVGILFALKERSRLNSLMSISRFLPLCWSFSTSVSNSPFLRRV